MLIKSINEITKKENNYEFQCEVCGKQVHKQRTALLRNQFLLCRSCLKLEKYGEDYLLKIGKKISNSLKNLTEEQKEKKQQKRKHTCLKKYGVEDPSKSILIKNKIKKTLIEKYSSIEQSYKIRAEKMKQTNAKKSEEEKLLIREKIKATNQKKYGGNAPLCDKKIACQSIITKKERYGDNFERIVEKSQQTKLKKYNDKHYNNSTKMIGTIKSIPNFYKNKSIKTAQTRSQLKVINGLNVDSTWEQAFIMTHPGCVRGPEIDYEYDGKIHKWCIDFEWEGKFYEVKNPFFFNMNYPKWNPESTWAKWKKSNELHSQGIQIRWYLWKPMFEANFPDYGELENFRNKCFIGNKKSPYDAWYDPILRFKAEENLAQQIGFGGLCLKKVLQNRYRIIDEIIERFTIAKIAPRVTSMSASQCQSLFKDYIPLLQQNGIYDPCGGFGGRKEFAQRNNIEYESYDVNPELIRLVGHHFQDLITMNTIKTSKIVLTSPPWNDKEVWPGSNGSITEIHEKEWWYNLIMTKIKASGYIFVNGTDNNHQGLFGKRNNKITTFGI
jgi:hypothetical protein